MDVTHTGNLIGLTETGTRDKTDSAFTINSEPEVRLHQLGDERVQLEVVDLNCFNPKLGMVEVGDSRQIMGIMVDIEYDKESFRARLINVRQVGRNQRTLKNLRAAFNREIDPAKWEQMLTTKTVPFDLPERGSEGRREGHRPDRDGTHDGHRRPWANPRETTTLGKMLSPGQIQGINKNDRSTTP